MFFRTPTRRQPVAFDDWDGAPPAGVCPKWLGGMVIPLGLVVYGMACLVALRGILPGWQAFLDLRGIDAVLLGLSSMAAGTFLHMHYFWGSVRRLSRWSSAGKTLALFVLIGSLGYLIIRIGFGL